MIRRGVRSGSVLRGAVVGSALPVALIVYDGEQPAGLALAQGVALYAVVVAVASAWWEGWTRSRPDPARGTAIRLIVGLTAAQALAVGVGQAGGAAWVRVGAFGVSALATPLIARWLRVGASPCAGVDLPTAVLLGAAAALRFPSTPLVPLTCVCAVLVVAAFTRGLFNSQPHVHPAPHPGPSGTLLLPAGITLLGWWYADSTFLLLRHTLGGEHRLGGVGAVGAAIGLAAWGAGIALALRRPLGSSGTARLGIVLTPLIVGLVAGASLASRDLLTVGGTTASAIVLSTALDVFPRPLGPPGSAETPGGARPDAHV